LAKRAQVRLVETNQWHGSVFSTGNGDNILVNGEVCSITDHP